MEREIDRKKVFVGLSGGVDSSVSAALLKDQGYDVTGVFIKVWHPDFLNCNWKAEMRDAMRVCARLEIPFIKLDLEKEYKKGVIDYMIDEYKKGRTPNPDVMCNKYVKFGGFYDWAIEQGADYVATGHYACTENGKLLKAHDQNKDQTYFLWTLTSKQLEHTLFPIGNLPKSKVRKVAQKNNLFTTEKKDSQGLCFIGHVDMKTFLQKYIETHKGDVVDEKGKILGEHDGAELYTLGERHGFNIFKKGTEDTPLYVQSKDLGKNTLTVSSQRVRGDVPDSITLEEINLNTHSHPELISGSQKTFSLDLEAQIRYRQELQKVKLTINPENGRYSIVFKEKQEALTPGQSVVFYDTNECIGGAIISDF